MERYLIKMKESIKRRTEKNICPCCGRHCDLSASNCERGREYLRTGGISERHEHAHREKHFRGQRLAHDHATDTNDKLVINLRELGHVLRFITEGKGSQSRILIILAEEGETTQQRLTGRLYIQPGSASEVLAKLEHAGLICRTSREDDRRTMDIRLTEAGRQSAEEAMERRNQRHQEMFSCFSEEEKETLRLLLEKLNTDWERRYRDGAAEHKHGHGESRCRKKGGEERHHRRPDHPQE